MVLSGSQIIIDVLRNWKIKYVFGGMGEDIAQFYDTLYGANDIKLIDLRDEKNLVYSAIGYSALSKTPAVCIATAGPGVANMFSGVYAAWREWAPILCLAPYPFQGHMAMHGYKSIDNLRVFESVTKASLECGHIDQLEPLMNRALRTAVTPPTGPVLLSIRKQLFSEASAETHIQSSEKWQSAAFDLHPDKEVLRQVARKLMEAEKPVMLCDTRVGWDSSNVEVAELADLLAIPIMCSAFTALRPVVQDDHPLYVGEYPGALSLRVMLDSDFLLAVNCDFDHLTTLGMLSESGITKGFFPNRIVQVDNDVSFLGRSFPVELAVLGNSKLVLRALINEIKSLAIDSTKIPNRRKRAEELTQKWRTKLFNEYQKQLSHRPINPLILAMDLGDLLQRDAIVSLSGATNAFWFNLTGVSHLSTPNSVLSFGTDVSLGGGLARAIGAKLASPERQVVTFLGDGEFWYGAVSELETLSRLNLPITLVISNNSSLGDDKFVQMKRYGARYIGVDIHNPDLAELGKVFGLYTIRVEDPTEVKQSVRKALSSGRPALVDVVTDFACLPEFFNASLGGELESFMKVIGGEN